MALVSLVDEGLGNSAYVVEPGGMRLLGGVGSYADLGELQVDA